MYLSSLSLLPVAVAHAEINAWLDRQQIADGETVNLTLQADGQTDVQPDLSLLHKDFEVLGQSRGSQINIINGRTESRTTWQLALSPRRTGVLTIPPLRVGAWKSPELKLEVTKASESTVGGAGDIFIESHTDISDPYVQGQILYTVMLFYSVEFSSGNLNVPMPGNVLSHQLGKDRSYRTQRNGKQYAVIERRFALFPQSSGAFTLQAPVFDGEIPDTENRQFGQFGRFFGRDPFSNLFAPARRVRVHGEDRVLQVKPRPPQARNGQWLPARAVELDEQWSPPGGEVRVGDPVTRTLTLKVDGLTGTQLPDFPVESIPGVNAYPDQGQSSTDIVGGSVAGGRVQKIAYVPTREGTLELPAIELQWWDTVADQPRRISLPARRIQVLAAAGGTSPATGERPMTEVPRGQLPVAIPDAPDSLVPSASDTAGEPDSRLMWLAAFLASAWLVTLLLWWRDHRRPDAGSSPNREPGAPHRSNPGASRRRFQAACNRGDAREARIALLDWAADHWPNNRPDGLSALADRFSDEKIRNAITELDKVLYGKRESEWNGRDLGQALKKLPSRTPLVRDSSPLPQLYP